MYVLHIDLSPPGIHNTLVHALAFSQSREIVLYLIEHILYNSAKSFLEYSGTPCVFEGDQFRVKLRYLDHPHFFGLFLGIPHHALECYCAFL